MDVLAKVRKLLAKANDSRGSEHEAQAALLKAQQLMIEHGLSMQDLSFEEVKREVLEAGETCTRLPWYAHFLAQVIAENFRCHVILRSNGNARKLVFVGLSADSTLALEVYRSAMQFLGYKLKDVRKAVKNDRAKANAYANDYAHGFTNGLKAKFKEQVQKQNWGLILVKDKAVTEYIDNLHCTKGRNVSFKSSGSRDAYDAGYEQGHNYSHSAGYIE